MYPDRDTLSNVPRSGYITARDQSMVESGMTKGGKNTARSCQFSFSWMKTKKQTRTFKLKRSSQKKNVVNANMGSGKPGSQYCWENMDLTALR